jgi:hypothetical protein
MGSPRRRMTPRARAGPRHSRRGRCSRRKSSPTGGLLVRPAARPPPRGRRGRATAGEACAQVRAPRIPTPCRHAHAHAHAHGSGLDGPEALAQHKRTVPGPRRRKARPQGSSEPSPLPVLQPLCTYLMIYHLCISCHATIAYTTYS